MVGGGVGKGDGDGGERGGRGRLCARGMRLTGPG